MTAAPKLATLAEAESLRVRSLSDTPSRLARDIQATCATVERLAEALKAITDAGGTADEIVAARALLTQLGATP